MHEVEIRILGPVEAELDGEAVKLGGSKQRSVLALLALNAGRVVSVDRLVDALWGDDPPATAVTALQGHVSRLRRLLGADVILTSPPGYTLNASAAVVDVAVFERMLAAPYGNDPAERAETLREALGLWRAHALAGLDLAEEAHTLDEERLTAQEDLFDAELALGRHTELVSGLEAFSHAHPLRERPVEQFMLALYRSGRQADALAAYRAFRRRLREEVGLDPGVGLRELERRMLRQDPELAPPLVAEPGDTTGLRTPVTVVAVGIGAAPENGDPDPEAYEQIVSRAREAVRLALERNGARVERAPGVGLVGLFGIPAPHEDDAARGLEAAAKAIEAAGEAAAAGVRFGLTLTVRAGVASGEAFGGETPAVERALALQAEADAGTMTADETTRARARGRELRLDRPLVGRDAERRSLGEACENALDHSRSAFVTLVGPPGIGKSRLAGDLLASLGPGTRVLYARCLSYGDGISLIPLIDLVRASTGLTSDVTEEVARRRLSALLADDERGEAATAQLLDVLGLTGEPADDEAAWAVGRLLVRTALTSPTVVLIDDLQWASPAMLELAGRLAEPVEAPLFTLATTRESPGDVPVRSVLELGPIDPQACSEMTASLLGSDAIDAEALTALVEQSGGNPLFLEELVLDLRAKGELTEDDGSWRLAADELQAPRSIESLLSARVERLPDRERDVLLAASIMGQSFSVAALENLAGDELDAPLDHLQAAELIRPSRIEAADLDFRHMLVRDAAYASLPLERRAELHRRHAESLAGASFATPLELEALAVYHLDEAHRALAAYAPGDERVLAGAMPLARRTLALGRVLLGRGDAAAAASLLARAVELGVDDPEATVDLGKAHLDIGDFDAAAEAFSEPADGTAAIRGRLGLLDIALKTDSDADLDAVGKEIEALRTELERRDETFGLADAWLLSGHIALVRGDSAGLSRCLEKALPHARRSGRHRPETSILFLVCATCWYGSGSVRDGIARCTEILAEARGRPALEAGAEQCLAVLRAMNGEVEEARRLVRSSRATRRELGQEIGAAASAIDEGIIELLAGDDAAAEGVLRDGYDELEQLGEKGYFSTLAALLAEAISGLGRMEEARALSRAAAEAASEDDVVSQVGWRTTEARALVSAGDREGAEAVAIEGARRADETDFLLLRAEAWAAVADATGSDPARETARAHLQRKGCSEDVIENWTRPRLART